MSLFFPSGNGLQNPSRHFQKLSVEVLIDVTLDSRWQRNFIMTTLALTTKTTSLYFLVFYSSVFTVSAYLSLN